VCGPLCKLALAFAEMTPAPAAPGGADNAGETDVGVDRHDVVTWLRAGFDIDVCKPPPAPGMVLALGFGAPWFGIDGAGELMDDSIGDDPFVAEFDAPNNARESSEELDEPEPEDIPPPPLA
jgi:hypothetical protein